MALDPTARRSRRALLASAIGGAAAVAATQLGGPGAALAADPNDVVKDADNPTVGTTSVSTTAAAAAFVGQSNAADTGIGLVGKSTFTPNTATELANVGVYGVAGADPPVDWVPDEFESGVYGYSDSSFVAAGVLGVSLSGYGAYGWGDYGVTGNGGTVGVEGFTDNGLGGGSGVGVLGYAGDGPPTIPANVGVMAMAPAAGTALLVSGRTKFSRAGRSYVLSQGRIAAEGTAAALTADETLRAGYLGL